MRKIMLLLTIIFILCAMPALAQTADQTDDVSIVSQSTPEALLQQWYDLGAQLRTLGNYPFTELSKGDIGFEVKALQTRLAELGYYEKAVVDNFGSGTYNAMRSFEKANDLKVNGIASVDDQTVLFGNDAVLNTETKTAKGGNRSDESDATSGATSK